MKKKISPESNQANQLNANKGTIGTNKQYDQAQGNKGKQLNPNQISMAKPITPKPAPRPPQPKPNPNYPSTKPGKPSGPGRGNEPKK